MSSINYELTLCSDDDSSEEFILSLTEFYDTLNLHIEWKTNEKNCPNQGFMLSPESAKALIQWMKTFLKASENEY